MNGASGKKDLEDAPSWKGKGKVTMANPPAEPEEHSESALAAKSLASRIAGSASGLTRDLFSSQAARSATSELASSATAIGEKSARAGPPSSSTGSEWMLDSSLKPLAETSGRSTTVSDRQGFREASRVDNKLQGQDTSDAFREFQNQNTFFEDPSVTNLPDQESESRSYQAQNWKASFARTHGADILDETERSSLGGTSASLTDVQLQERTDGADVLALLNPENEEFDLENELQTTHNAFEFQLKEPDRELFPETSKGPETEASSEKVTMDAAQQGYKSQQWPELIPEDASTEMVQQLITEWHNALSSYTDVVWGLQNPFGNEVPVEVQNAQHEVEQMKAHDNYGDKQAVRRLNMVLRHLK